jgi:hypothetical protein
MAIFRDRVAGRPPKRVKQKRVMRSVPLTEEEDAVIQKLQRDAGIETFAAFLRQAVQFWADNHPATQ